MKHQAVISMLCGAALLGTTTLSPVRAVAATGEQMAKVQEIFAYVSAAATITAATISIFTTPGCPFPGFCGGVQLREGNAGTGGNNFDIPAELVDAAAIVVGEMQGQDWDKFDKELTAAVRKMGSKADLMGEETEKAFLDKEPVLVQSLENMGLEALEDPEGNYPTKVEDLLGAQAKIQDAFGTVSQDQLTAGTKNLSNGNNTNNTPTITMEATQNLNTGVNPSGISDEDLKKLRTKRREAHLQKVATAGAARGQLMKTVAKSEAKTTKEMRDYIGKGDGLVANIKILTGLDLALVQRLNTLNMVQGQQVANEAAAALQMVE